MAEGDIDLELHEQLADALLALSNVELGDYKTRITAPAGNEQLGSLFDGINDMIAALDEEQRKLQAYQAERRQRLEMIERQQQAIRDLSTPILDVWEGVLCLPVIGTIDTARSAEMTRDLLQAIAARGTRYTIVDVTGIAVMDTSTAQHFIHMAQCVRMLGSECALTGINPSIAQTIVHMGIDLRGIVTHRSLRDALRRFIVRQERGETAAGPAAANGRGSSGRRPNGRGSNGRGSSGR